MPETIPTIIFIRHGQTNWNAVGRIQGQFNSSLSELGKSQAARNGQAMVDILAGLDRTEKDFDWVASPLRRTCNTMQIVRREMGLGADDFRRDPILKEISFGEWEGYTRAQIKELQPEAYRARRADKWAYRPPKAESWRDLFRRTGEWLKTVERDTIVVSHGGVSKMMRGHLLKLDPEEIMQLDIPQDKVYLWNGQDGVFL